MIFWQQINIDYVTLTENAQHALLAGVVGRGAVKVATVEAGAWGRASIFLLSLIPSGQ